MSGHKQVSVSSDDITYHLLPGGTGEMTREGAIIKDTILGQTYESEFVGSLNWGLNANAVYKGFPGYVAKLLKPGTSTVMTSEPCALVSGKTYRVTATARRIINRAVTLVVFDGATDVTSQVLNVDFLFGKVTFKSTYTVVGAVTITGAFFPMVTLGKFQSLSLTQTAAAIDNSDMPTLQGNGGWETRKPGLKTVGLSLPSVFSATDDWHTALINRAEYIIELNPDGTGIAGSVARGFFRLTSDSQSGDVGALEVETLNFSLNVPTSASTALEIAVPFSWEHGTSSPIPTAIQKALTAWQTDTLLFARYLHNGTTGWKGSGVVTNISMNAGMDSPNLFTVSMEMSGAPTAVV